jgi:hypothetical protein
VRFHIDQPPSPRDRRVIRRRFVQPHPQKSPQSQRVLRPAERGNAAVATQNSSCRSCCLRVPIAMPPLSGSSSPHASRFVQNHPPIHFHHGLLARTAAGFSCPKRHSPSCQPYCRPTVSFST